MFQDEIPDAICMLVASRDAARPMAKIAMVSDYPKPLLLYSADEVTSTREEHDTQSLMQKKN